jgi:hypothetical protein
MKINLIKLDCTTLFYMHNFDNCNHINLTLHLWTLNRFNNGKQQIVNLQC